MDPDTFTRAYIGCALWSSNDESRPDGGDPLDDNYDIGDLSPLCFATMVNDCSAFQRAFSDELTTREMRIQAGHDFWLTRCGHGAGFWDRDADTYGSTTVRDQLDKAARACGEQWLYVGDDGKIHIT